MLGTRLPELIWKTQHFLTGRSLREEYLESVNHPGRRVLVQRLSAHAPESVLEIGCGMGANLYLLAKEFPMVKLYGIDISSKAVKEGRKWFEEAQVKNVELFASKADGLGWLEDKCIDIVFTYATLMYIGNDKIDKVLAEMVRIARKSLILYEWDIENSSKGYRWYYGHWIYNYKTFLEKYFSSDKITVSKLPQGLWGDENWEEYGVIIEAWL